MNIEDIKADRKAGTQGDFSKSKVQGWGTDPDNIISAEWESGDSPVATFPRSKANYYRHERYTDEHGDSWTRFTEKTDDGEQLDLEKSAEREANIRRFARVPQLEEAVIAYDDIEIIAKEFVGFKADTHHHDGDDYISMDAATWYAFQNDMEAAITKIKNAMGDRS